MNPPRIYSDSQQFCSIHWTIQADFDDKADCERIPAQPVRIRSIGLRTIASGGKFNFVVMLRTPAGRDLPRTSRLVY